MAIFGALVLVLLIACVNVTNLLLARSTRRRSEFALRAALSAGRRRLIRQLLSESLLLAVIGGVLGMVIAQIGVRALVALRPPAFPRVGAISVDGAVFAVGLGITSLVGLMVGLAPALRASPTDPHDVSLSANASLLLAGAKGPCRGNSKPLRGHSFWGGDQCLLLIAHSTAMIPRDASGYPDCGSLQ